MKNWNLDVFPVYILYTFLWSRRTGGVGRRESEGVPQRCRGAETDGRRRRGRRLLCSRTWTEVFFPLKKIESFCWLACTAFSWLVLDWQLRYDKSKPCMNDSECNTDVLCRIMLCFVPDHAACPLPFTAMLRVIQVLRGWPRTVTVLFGDPCCYDPMHILIQCLSRTLELFPNWGRHVCADWDVRELLASQWGRWYETLALVILLRLWGDISCRPLELTLTFLLGPGRTVAVRLQL